MPWLSNDRKATHCTCSVVRLTIAFHRYPHSHPQSHLHSDRCLCRQTHLAFWHIRRFVSRSKGSSELLFKRLNSLLSKEEDFKFHSRTMMARRRGRRICETANGGGDADASVIGPNLLSPQTQCRAWAHALQWDLAEQRSLCPSAFVSSLSCSAPGFWPFTRPSL